MDQFAIKVENLYKQYRLGQVSTGTIVHDLNRYWYKIRGKENPYYGLTSSNDRESKSSGEYVWALQDINFEVKQGDVMGIIGNNGAGKSTLLKLLSKVTAPTKGNIRIKGSIASLLEVGTGFHPELSGRDNIFLNGAILGMSKAEIQSKFDEIVDFSGVERYIDTPVKRYSSGMYVRLAFAVAAHLDPEILIIDEVLAVGDAEFQKKCLDKMKVVSKQGRTVLFVSHNISSIRALCKTGILLEKGRLKYSGDIKDVITHYLMKSETTSYLNQDDDKIKLIKTSIGNEEGETNSLEYGDTLVVNLTFFSPTPIQHPYFWISVKSRFGSLFAASSLIDGNRPSEVVGEFTVTYKFPNLKLLPQEYFITVGARESDGYSMLITSLEIGGFHMVTPVQELGMNGLLAEEMAKDTAPLLMQYDMFINDRHLASFTP
jgi:lipopolysaccharide transport system ATP-binding protein